MLEIMMPTDSITWWVSVTNSDICHFFSRCYWTLICGFSWPSADLHSSLWSWELALDSSGLRCRDCVVNGLLWCSECRKLLIDWFIDWVSERASEWLSEWVSEWVDWSVSRLINQLNIKHSSQCIDHSTFVMCKRGASMV